MPGVFSLDCPFVRHETTTRWEILVALGMQDLRRFIVDIPLIDSGIIVLSNLQSSDQTVPGSLREFVTISSEIHGMAKAATYRLRLVLGWGVPSRW